MTDLPILSAKFFELEDIRATQGRPWIPLRENRETKIDRSFAGSDDLRHYSGIATLAVEAANRTTVDKFEWGELDVSTHYPSVEKGIYRPIDTHTDWSEDQKVVGTRLVIAQELSGYAREAWHLHYDIVCALKLEQEGDTWFRPEEGWVEVARLKRNEEGKPVCLEMRAEMLSDYLAARGMALFFSAYHERSAYFVGKPDYTWASARREWTADRDKREVYITEAEFPHDPAHSFCGLGALWRTEWFEPQNKSVRVRGDEETDDVSFAVGNEGERKTASECIGAMTYLAFKPTLVPALLHYRGGFMGWYSRDTGGIGTGETGTHFGVNSLGLITIFAKDIAKLESWEQRVWAAHSTAFDGGASEELFDTQMNCKPASTGAPEASIKEVIEELDQSFQSQHGAPLLRDHESIDGILKRAHRFRAVEQEGVLALAKELHRLFAERINLQALREPAGVGAKEKLRELKTLERLIARSVGDTTAKSMMAPLFGISDLRNADAHLGSSFIESGLERAKVQTANTHEVEQGMQLLAGFVDTIREITKAIVANVNKQCP